MFCSSLQPQAAFVSKGFILQVPLLMPGYAGGKEESLAGKPPRTALLGVLHGSVSFLTRLIPGDPIKVGSW